MPDPETKIMPLAYAPRFTYFRQTDHGDTISGDPDRTSPFGHEQTHFCIMSKDDDPRRVQCQLIQGRLDQLEKQMEAHSQAVEDAELECVRGSLTFEAKFLIYIGKFGVLGKFRDVFTNESSEKLSFG